LLNLWISKNAQVLLSLGMIIVCIGGAIIYSLWYSKKYPEKVDLIIP